MTTINGISRWHSGLNANVVSAKADAFMADILAVYKKHGLSLSPGDVHAGMLIEEHSDLDESDLNNASLGTTVTWEVDEKGEMPDDDEA